MRAALAVVDVETSYLRDGETPLTLFWGLYIEGEEYRRFDSTDALWQFLDRRRAPLRLYHHHDFDAVQAMVDGYDLSINIFRNGRVVRAGSHGRHTWINSYALFPSPLADLLSAAGYIKKPLGCPAHATAPMAEYCAACMLQLEERNVSDCVEALSAFRTIETAIERVTGLAILDGRSATQAGYALRCAEAVAGPVPVDLNRFARLAIRGGRCEAFEIGNRGEVTCWDINSSYPYAFTVAPPHDTLVMGRATVPMDTAYPYHWRLPPCCAHAGTVEHSPCDMDKLLFPAGTFITMAFGLSGKTLAGIKRLNIDLRWINALAPFMQDMYNLRAASRVSSPPLAYGLKILLNSIYGKLAYTGEIEIPRLTRTLPPRDCLYVPLTHGRYLVSTFHHARRHKANYGLAAWILWNARDRLAGALRDGVVYCDTDSIYTRGAAPAPIGSAFGAWKREAAGDIVIHGAKDYIFAGDVKLKGGSEYLRWTLKSAAGGVRLVKRASKTVYDKRHVAPGGTTYPLTFRE